MQSRYTKNQGVSHTCIYKKIKVHRLFMAMHLDVQFQ